MKILMFTFLFFALVNALSWPLDYFRFGEMTNPAVTTEIDGEQVSLDNLNNDVLLEICSMVKDVPGKVDDPYPRGIMQIVQAGAAAREKLSALTSLSMVNSRFRSLTAPTLFRGIKVDGDWKKASRGLELVERCPAMLDNIRSFRLSVFTEFDVGPAPPRDFAPRLVRVLSQMPKLDTLFLALPEHHTDAFVDEFQARNLTLDGVKEIVVGSYCDFAINHCPNVERVASNGWVFLHSKRGGYDKLHATKLIESAAKAPNLTYFEMNQWWRVSQLEEVLSEMPHIKRLAMPGGRYENPVTELYPIFAKFKHLEEVVLADASSLDVGFEPPWCGNAYMGPGGAELAARVAAEGEEARDNVAKAMFAACKPLKRLWVGDWSQGEAQRDEMGQVLEIRWNSTKRDAPSGWVV